MKITQSKYKNVFALRLETEKYVALVLPSEGGKIASFQDKANGKEYLLQNTSPTYLHIGMTDDFEKGECSGFDDMFPTIDAVTVDGNDYPDHGEVCRVPFSYQIHGETLLLYYRSQTLGYDYKKRFAEDENGKLRVFYEIENLTEHDLDVLWAGHCLVPIEKGGCVLVPFEEGIPVDIVYDSRNQIQKDKRVAYQSEYLRTDWADGTLKAQKLYFFQKCAKGYVGYQYPQGDTFVLEFDEKQLPYLGIWLDYGTVNGNFCVGLEPCTVGYDTVVNAEKYGQKRIIRASEVIKLHIALSIKVDDKND